MQTEGHTLHDVRLYLPFVGGEEPWADVAITTLVNRFGTVQVGLSGLSLSHPSESKDPMIAGVMVFRCETPRLTAADQSVVSAC